MCNKNAKPICPACGGREFFLDSVGGDHFSPEFGYWNDTEQYITCTACGWSSLESQREIAECRRQYEFAHVFDGPINGRHNSAELDRAYELFIGLTDDDSDLEPAIADEIF